MHNTHNRNGRSLGLLPRQAAGLLALALPLAACNLDKTLQVYDPFTVTPEVARDTVNLINSYAGAKARLATAIGGVQNSSQGLVVTTGLFADEFYSADSFSDRQEIDTRSIQSVNPSNLFSYTYLQRTRAEANNAAALYASTSRKGSSQHIELLNISGYAELLLAENYCSGVPFSTIPLTGATQYGVPLTTTQVYDSAIAKFDAALALATDTPQIRLAHLGKARVLLDKGQYAAASAEVAGIPTSYKYAVPFSNSTQSTYNAIEQLVNEEKRFSASDLEGTVNHGLPFRTANDGRTPTKFSGAVAGFSGGPHYAELKYGPIGDRSSEVVLASGIEARYIEAEALIQSNASDAVILAKLNDARVAAGGTGAALTSADLGTTMASRVDLLFRERAFSMWLTAHRLSDLRRLIRQYGRTQANVFPTGLTPQGLTYGTDVNLPIPFQETSNPNALTGCIDRNA